MADRLIERTPTDVAAELGVDPKRVRDCLREKFPRPTDEKYASWVLDDEMVSVVKRLLS